MRQREWPCPLCIQRAEVAAVGKRRNSLKMHLPGMGADLIREQVF
jgi:hypothetical protein